MTKFITLAGRKQVGKDTSAHMIKMLMCDTLHLRQWGDTAGPWTLAKDPVQNNVLYIRHFADALKRACTAIFGIAPEDMETEEGKQKVTDVVWPHSTLEAGQSWIPHVHIGHHDGYHESQMTVREVLQFVGTELLRTQLDPDVWVQSIFRQPYNENDIVIIADCRFPNEAKFGKEHGLLISIERITGLDGDGHASETSLDDYNDYHYTISNNSSFEVLRTQLQAILEAEGFLS